MSIKLVTGLEHQCGAHDDRVEEEQVDVEREQVCQWDAARRRLAERLVRPGRARAQNSLDEFAVRQRRDQAPGRKRLVQVGAGRVRAGQTIVETDFFAEARAGKSGTSAGSPWRARSQERADASGALVKTATL